MKFSRPEYWNGCSLSLLQGTFPTQGLNPGLRHCGRILYQLSHPGSPELGVTVTEVPPWSLRPTSPLPFRRLGPSGAGPRGQREAGKPGGRSDTGAALGVGGQMEGSHTLTPNICRRSGSLNRKGMLETCSRLGCCFSVGSEGWSGWLSVCAASSVCCGERTRAGRWPSSAPTV